MNIKQDIIPGLDQPALNAVKIVVAHESGNPNNTGPDSLENEINYMKNNWNRGAKAYTSHWVGGGGRIVQLAETGKRQNGAGWPANGIAYAHVELARTDSKETFKEDYKAYVGLLRHLAKEANLPVTFDSNDDKGIKSHDWVRKNLGGTTHTDPFAYLASHGVGKSQFAHDVENGIGGEVEVSEPSTNKSILQMANEVIKGLHGNGHANRRVSLGVNQSVYNKIKSEVNRKLGALDRSISKNPASFHYNLFLCKKMEMI
ncbi:N-acetylmuramoyl-L-alanine amidase [Lentibacillus salicampi]|uniref:Autolysin n=1 Tax=Lentibacillus salicampi TaxID=175306 RepID=A0A4Y9A8G7_9BACI|nr:N-acetylmuramoyl-L-alanine amidase [Lentibacillus salicampi]TFJ92128.1 N-acetylmuramoyl-L-alanine amidase [Lentibacillus salicampi]